ncbi:hypothetical protein TWF696_001292 [Orbilia brochopaga]|uniref:Uncharacterized protein n=1 Tax=Orbilia brochopaga TaxID=3140254 RepID=A0AAV9U871_9PEZI
MREGRPWIYTVREGPSPSAKKFEADVTSSRCFPLAWCVCPSVSRSITTFCVRVYIPAPLPLGGRSVRRSARPTLCYIVFSFYSMTLYIPTITAPFEPNCLHPKAPFEFLDDHTSETKAIGIDIGRNSSTGGVGSSVDSDDGPRKINSAIHTYCVMSQVGVAAGVIVIIFTFLSILLLLLLSYQATDYLIERRALELLQHHALPSMVQRGIAPISNAYQTLASAIPPLRGAIPDEESNIHAHEYHPPSQRSVHVADGGITALHSSSGGRDGSFGGGMGMGMGVGMGMRPAVTNYVQPPLREKSGYTDVRSGTENAARSNHDRIQSGEQSVQQLQGWVTGGFEVDRR